jgi:hypothetical protein
MDWPEPSSKIVTGLSSSANGLSVDCAKIVDAGENWLVARALGLLRYGKMG